MQKDLPAIQKAYDLAKEVVQRTAKYPKSYKYSLGDRITGRTLDILENLLRAAYSMVV